MRTEDLGNRFRQSHRVVIVVATSTLLYSALLFAADAPMSPNVDKVDLDELFTRLKNPNPAPFIDKNAAPWKARFPANYNWAGQARALDAWEELHQRFAEALPELVSHVNDNTYCVTIVSPTGAERNMTVGQLCEYLLRLNIEIYKRPYFRTHTYQGFLISFDDRKPRQFSRAIEMWWDKRKGQSIAELQLEAVQWQLDHFEPSQTFEGMSVSKEAIEEIKESLEAFRRQLIATGKLDRSIDWRVGDEISLPSSPKKP